MFRRTKTPTPPPAPVKEGGKGRPTPSRREAEAATKARAKGPTDKKSVARQQRARRGEANAKMREAMRTGDDRYLPTRDKGPVRHFVRDFVDRRLCMAELLLPFAVIILFASPFSSQLGSRLWGAALIVIALDTGLLIFGLRRELGRRFADRSTRGATGYALVRSLQLRFTRLPKPQVKLGTKLPERY